MGIARCRRRFSPLVLWVALMAVGVLLGCVGGGTNSRPSGSTGTVNTSISDPPICSATFDHIYVTITKVTANTSANAGPSDTGWITLLDLTSSPKQIDLLSLVSNTCILTQLGSTSGLTPGSYEQIRLYLLANTPASGTATPSSNACPSGSFNCVMPHGAAAQILQLSSEAQTGIKIPTSQISSGGLTIAAGKTSDLSIDFDSCTSIVRNGNGSYRLKPVLHAGEVDTTNNAISGTVLDQSGNPISGAIVLLELPDSNNIDRVQFSGFSASDGTFIFCPLPNPSGNAVYDVVAAAQVNAVFSTTTYNPTVALNVPVGTDLKSVTMVPQSGSTSAAGISGQVITTGSAGATPADVTLSVLEQLSSSSVNQITVPVFGATSQPPVVTTIPCPVNSECFNYTLLVPAGNPQVGTFMNGGIIYGPTTGTVAYTLEGASQDCTGVSPAGGDITSIPATAGLATKVGPLSFTGCTAP